MDAGGDPADDYRVDPDKMPTDPLQLAALVALAVADVLSRDEAELELLLASFRRAAWPSHRCEQQ